MKLITFFTLVTFFALAESQVGRGRMFNGQNVPDRKFTSLAHIISTHKGSLDLNRCSATIINVTWVLTAAHCLIKNGVVPDKIVVYMGSTIKNSDYEKYVIVKDAKTKVHIHEDYNREGNTENDIALIQTPEIPISENITVASLPDKRPPIESTVQVAGWGSLTSTGYSSTIAQWGDFMVLNNIHCKFRAGFAMYDNQLCLYKKKSQICPGDSGGPAYSGKSVVGVVSLASTRGCEQTRESVFASVFDYLEWINEKYSKFGA